MHTPRRTPCTKLMYRMYVYPRPLVPRILTSHCPKIIILLIPTNSFTSVSFYEPSLTSHLLLAWCLHNCLCMHPKTNATHIYLLVDHLTSFYIHNSALHVICTSVFRFRYLFSLQSSRTELQNCHD